MMLETISSVAIDGVTPSRRQKATMIKADTSAVTGPFSPLEIDGYGAEIWISNRLRRLW